MYRYTLTSFNWYQWTGLDTLTKIESWTVPISCLQKQLRKFCIHIMTMPQCAPARCCICYVGRPKECPQKHTLFEVHVTSIQTGNVCYPTGHEHHKSCYFISHTHSNLVSSFVPKPLPAFPTFHKKSGRARKLQSCGWYCLWTDHRQPLAPPKWCTCINDHSSEESVVFVIDYWTKAQASSEDTVLDLSWG